MKSFFLSYYIKKEKARQNGDAPIYARVTVKGKPVTLSTGFYIAPLVWKRTQQLKLAKSEAEKKLKRELNNIEHTLQGLVHELKARKEQITSANLKGAYNYSEQPQKEYYLSDAFKLWLDNVEEQVRARKKAKGTLNKYYATQKHVIDYLKAKYNKDDIKLTDLSYEFILGFDLYLRNKRKIGNNTTVKYIRFLRAVNNLARKFEWTVKDAFAQYDGKLEEEETVFLTEEEINKIQNHRYNYERLQVVADIFLFSCYTGYAPVDVGQLREDNLVKHADGQIWVFKNRQKTDTKANVPLLPPALALINKYKNHPQCADGRLFPARSNQKQNATLKLIQEVTGTRKKLTCYVSRHSFACLMLSKGIPLEIVSKMMGHKRITQTQHYAKVLQENVGAAMKKLSSQYQQNESAQLVA